ncbi:hypothetical protein [Streptomyces sp. NPDC012746]|uniref:hypothetical protein n=1 Tax=Streptomyces sp. NPDC012746 TaxID=3364845 RepID=UPI00368D50EB
MSGTDEVEEQMYEITYLGGDDPATFRVAAAEVAGLIEQAGSVGATILIRPYARPATGRDAAVAGKGAGQS